MTTDYHQRAQTWAIDGQRQAARSRRIAWTMVGCVSAIAMLEAVALAMLTPLKTVEPITLLVDRQTGHVQALDPTTPQRVSADDALTQSFLAQYVIAREGFDRSTVPLDYRKVALWSAGAARRRYLASMPATNPDSPFNRYPAGATVGVRVKSVSRLNTNLAMVRFDTQRSDRQEQAERASSWVAIVRYRFVDAPMSMADRLSNPLGFQVTAYRRDAEDITPDAHVAATATPPAGLIVRTASAIVPPPDSVGIQARHDSPARKPVPVYVAGTVRSVPINQLPLGSPLSPGRTASERGEPQQ